jgi:DNA-directed RNA polymerase sigma subunit (sigma70/sigma32)
MGPGLEHFSKILRRLTPRQEKVVRLRFGFGCKRSHSVSEIAAEFGVSASLIARILEAAISRLAEAGVTMRELAKSARHPAMAFLAKSRHRHRGPN